MAYADSRSPWPEAQALWSRGIGVSGFAAADGLLHFAPRVTALDDVLDDLTSTRASCWKCSAVRSGRPVPPQPSRRRGPGHRDRLAGRSPLLVQAAARGVAIWSEVELAWRLSRPDKIVPWLGITGTNGKTTTTQMLESDPDRCGLRTAAVGNIGRPIMEIVLDPQPYDVLAVSSPVTSCTGPIRWPCIRPPSSTCSPITWSGTARTGLSGRQGHDLRRRASQLRLQRRRPGHRADGRAGRGGRRCPSDRLHAGNAWIVDAGRGR